MSLARALLHVFRAKCKTGYNVRWGLTVAKKTDPGKTPMQTPVGDFPSLWREFPVSSSVTWRTPVSDVVTE